MQKSRKLVLVAASVVVVAAVAAFAIHAKRKSDRRAELVNRVKSYIAAVTEIEACVATATHPDFLTSVAFGRGATTAGSRKWLDDCRDAYDKRMEGFEDTIKGLGVAASGFESGLNIVSRSRIALPDLDDLNEVSQLRGLCTWIHWAHVDIETLARAAGLPEPQRPECSFGDPYKRWPSLLESIGDYVSWPTLELPNVSLRAATPATLDNVTVFYRSTEPDDESIIGLSRDGKTVDTLEVPLDAVVVAIAPKWFVALTRSSPKGPVELRVYDGNVWRPTGKLPARDFTQLHATANLLTAVGAPAGQAQLVEVQRSVDGGKTFGAPIRVSDTKGSLWSDVRIERDGAVVALAATASTFDVMRLEPTGKQPQRVAQLAFKEPIKDAEVALCRGRDTYWVLADDRWLLGSSDAGKTWREAADLGASTTVRAVYCVEDRVLVTRSGEAGVELVACGPAACEKPVTIDRSPAQLLFARATGKDLEVWIEDTKTERSDGLIWIYRLANGALAPVRFDLLPTERNKGRRVMLTNIDNSIGWLDPRGGLGELPWSNARKRK